MSNERLCARADTDSFKVAAGAVARSNSVRAEFALSFDDSALDARFFVCLELEKFRSTLILEAESTGHSRDGR